MFRYRDRPFRYFDFARGTLVGVGDFRTLGRLVLLLLGKVAVGAEGIGDAIVTKGVEAGEDGGTAESVQADWTSEGGSLRY